MTIPSQMHPLALRTVLVAIDQTDDAQRVLTTARALASAAGAALHVCHVIPSVGRASEHPHGGSHVSSVLRSLQWRAEDAAAHDLVGEPAAAINALAARINADVIIFGPHRERIAGDRTKVLGGTAMMVVTNAVAPCLLAVGSLALPLQRVLVPIDTSATARGALLAALSWASALRTGGVTKNAAPRTTLTVLHVGVDERALDDALTAIRGDAGNWAGVEIVGTVISGSSVPNAIAEYATAMMADLVVLGTRGLGLDGVDRLGAVSGATTRLLETPVLLVPPAVWGALAPSRQHLASDAGARQRIAR